MLSENWYHYLRFLMVVAVLVAAKYVSQKLRHRRLAKKWNTEPIRIHRNVFRTIPIFIRNFRDSDSGYFLQRLNSRFEELDINAFSLTVPVMKSLVLSRSPEAMKALFSTQEGDFNLGVRRPAFGPLLGNGIFASEGQKWKHARALLKPSFTRDQVGDVRLLEPHVQSLAKHIRNKEGQLFDIEFLFYAFTLDAATHFLFGESVDVLSKDELEDGKGPVKSDFDLSLGFVGTYLQMRSSLFDLYWLANSKAFRKSIKSIHDFTDQFVEKALSLKPEEIEARSREGYIFLYELVKSTRNPIEIRDELLNIMIAGRATTASLLSSAFSELSRNPGIWRKLREEVILHFGRGENAEDMKSITFETLKRCTYLKWVVNETLRLWPSVPSNLREAAKDTTLPNGGGKDGRAPLFVPKGTIVVILIYCIHRMKSLYGEDADEFRPERWAGLSKIGWGFMPFGSGPRVCLGQQFALTEVSYVLVRLAQMFEHLDYDGSSYPPKTLANAVIKYKDGVNVRMT